MWWWCNLVCGVGALSECACVCVRGGSAAEMHHVHRSCGVGSTFTQRRAGAWVPVRATHCNFIWRHAVLVLPLCECSSILWQAASMPHGVGRPLLVVGFLGWVDGVFVVVRRQDGCS